jgi:hypothetical protein
MKNCLEYLKIINSRNLLLRNNKKFSPIDINFNQSLNNSRNLYENINNYLTNDRKINKTPNSTFDSTQSSVCSCSECSIKRDTNSSFNKPIDSEHLSNTANIFMMENSSTTTHIIKASSNDDEYKDIQENNNNDDDDDIIVISSPSENNAISKKTKTLNDLRKSKPITIACKDGSEFKTTYFIERVIINNSMNKFNKQNFRKMYCCKICPYKKNMMSHLKAHLQNHKFYKGSIKCRYCEYYAFNSFKIKQHEILHSDYEPQDQLVIKVNMHYCNSCPYKTVNINNLDKHLLRHYYQENHYKCRYCNYYLTKKTHLASHEILHTEYQKD